MLLAGVITLCAWNSASAESPAASRAVRQPVGIEIAAHPLEGFDLRDKSRRQFGSLRFRSGLVLTSPYSRFGGISAMRLDAKGEGFIALSDRGEWFTGRIAYRGRDMAGLLDVESGPMLGADGRPLAARGWYDAESLAIDGTTLYVGIERVNRLMRFDFRRDGMRALGDEMPTPPAFRKLPYNKGPEALLFVPERLAHDKNPPLAGALIAISERGLDAAGNIIGFAIGGAAPGQFTVRRRDDFDVSDAVLLPAGDILLLERKFSILSGVGIRVRRLALDAVKPGALLDGPSIFDADFGYEIDNMEAIDAHVGPDGETVLTMISDDNFSFIQRTLILQFTLAEP